MHTGYSAVYGHASIHVYHIWGSTQKGYKTVNSLEYKALHRHQPPTIPSSSANAHAPGAHYMGNAQVGKLDNITSCMQ